ncbi:hypothetical protein IFM89_003381 [Coptis chinensis]|uniref:FAS1 domain-containing protein n=1 Tax=Coptis chinensis TaxID=261450 RepID=A0A835MH64_9MAGN|nr:hypothetical protein IFM89_003381 [Coptis chinensis]
MSHWYFTAFVLFLLIVAQPTASVNQIDLQTALEDMRAMSYHGFVILLQMLNSDRNSLKDHGQLTFLMPDDAQLSSSAISREQLREFLLSHSLPTALPLNNLIHLPTGTIMPSSFAANKTITITNHGRLNFVVNNARIVEPNICSSASIKCHGVANIIGYGNAVPLNPHELPHKVSGDSPVIPNHPKVPSSSKFFLGTVPPMQ